MNVIERAIRRVDATQQRHKPSAFVFGVVKKYGDDNGGVLVANLAYSGFVSLFPLLLILVTILGLVASGDPALRASTQRGREAGPAHRPSARGQRSSASALQRLGPYYRHCGADLGNVGPRPGRLVHDGAGVEPARA
jgi:hypothetical protein